MPIQLTIISVYGRFLNPANTIPQKRLLGSYQTRCLIYRCKPVEIDILSEFACVKKNCSFRVSPPRISGTPKAIPLLG